MADSILRKTKRRGRRATVLDRAREAREAIEAEPETSAPVAEGSSAAEMLRPEIAAAVEEAVASGKKKTAASKEVLDHVRPQGREMGMTVRDMKELIRGEVEKALSRARIEEDVVSEEEPEEEIVIRRSRVSSRRPPRTPARPVRRRRILHESDEDEEESEESEEEERPRRRSSRRSSRRSPRRGSGRRGARRNLEAEGGAAGGGYGGEIPAEHGGYVEVPYAMQAAMDAKALEDAHWANMILGQY